MLVDAKYWKGHIQYISFVATQGLIHYKPFVFMSWVDFYVTLWKIAKMSLFKWKTIIYIALQKFSLDVSLLP